MNSFSRSQDKVTKENGVLKDIAWMNGFKVVAKLIRNQQHNKKLCEFFNF